MKQRHESLHENEFYDLPYKTQKKYMKATLHDLIDKLESITERVDDYNEKTPHYSFIETRYTDDRLATTLQLLIAERLGFFMGYDMLQIMNNLHWENRGHISDLEEKFKNHRHNREKTYTEKPVY